MNHRSRETRSRFSARDTSSAGSTFLRKQRQPRSSFAFAKDTAIVRDKRPPIECPSIAGMRKHFLIV